MKKLLALLLALIMCLTVLTACDIKGTVGGVVDQVKGAVTGVVSQIKDKVDNLINPEPPVVDTQADVAITLLKSSYKDWENTAADYTLEAYTHQGEVKVEWSVNVGEEHVKITADYEKGVVYVDVNDESLTDVAYTLTAKVTDAEGNVRTISFDLVLPKDKLTTYDELVAAEKDATLKVQGIVTGIIKKSDGWGANSLYLQDEENKGGYYAYNLADEEIAGVEVGMTVKVVGTKDTYNGIYEVMNGKVTIVDTTIKTVTPVDYTEVFTNAADTKATDLVYRQSMLVTIKGVEISSQNLSNGYLNFKLGGKEAYVRISSSNNCITKDVADALKVLHGDNFGNTADVTGIIQLYNGALYLIPATDVPAFSNIKEVEKTPAEKVEAEKSLITIETDLSVDEEHTLPVAGEKYDDVVITWTSTDAGVVIDGGKLTFANITETTKVTLTATLTCGDKTDTVTFEVTARVAEKQLYIGKPTAEVEAGTAYKFGFNQVNLGKTLYLTGEVSGRYLVTTEYVAEAVDVYAELVEGGVKFYILNGETKSYIEVYNNAEGKLSVQFSANGSVFAYNATVNAWVTNFDGTDYYLGTYKTFNTLSASALSFITAENTGVSQFPANVYVLATAEYATEATHEVVADTAYKFGFNQVNLGKTLYLTGEVSGRYLVTTEYLSEAVDVYAELVEGGVKFYILNGETKNYIEVYNNAEGKLSVQFSANGSVFAYNATVNAWVTNFEGTDYYLGTYKTFNTLSASALSFITAENTGVSQFPANVYSLTLKETAVVNKSEVSEGVDYKFGFVQGNLGKTFYLTGEVSGRYLVTTEYYNEAVTIYVEKVEGGVKFYYLDGETKNYIEVYNNAEGKLSVQFSANGSVFAYNATVNAWVTNFEGSDYYLGTYKTFNTLSASALSFITAENTGVSQFPANFFRYEFVIEETETPEAPAHTCESVCATCGKCTDAACEESVCAEKCEGHEVVETPTTGVVDPVVGTAYAFGMVQGNVGKTYYLKGGMNGFYMETTENIADSLHVYIEETTGGYYLYCYVGTTKTYINCVVSGTHVNGAYEATASTVYTYDAESKTLIADVDGTPYWFGTRNDKTYTTVGPCAVSYKGFYCQFYAVETSEEPVVPAHECESECATCGKCTDAACTESVCAEKCEGHTSTPDAESTTISFADKSARTEFSNDVQVWANGAVTVTNNKASSTSNIGDYANPVRFYKSTEVVIECEGMTSIVFNVNTKDKNTSGLVNALTDTASYDVTVNGSVVTVTFKAPTNSLTFVAAAQFRVDSIVVYH